MLVIVIRMVCMRMEVNMLDAVVEVSVQVNVAMPDDISKNPDPDRNEDDSN
jgi:hypothetical protein